LDPDVLQDDGFTSETAKRQTVVSELKLPLHGGFRSETEKNLTAIYLTFNGHSPTDSSVRSDVAAM
jgi:hypothetical protein